MLAFLYGKIFEVLEQESIYKKSSDEYQTNPGFAPCKHLIKCILSKKN
jgi:hypothetical protein